MIASKMFIANSNPLFAENIQRTSFTFATIKVPNGDPARLIIIRVRNF
jgi:hypothetical protein